MKSFLSKAAAIARVTANELLNDKIVYNGLFVAILLTVVTIFISQLSYSTPERIILDFGLTIARISLSMIAAITGALLLHREFDRKTYHLVVIRPVRPFTVVLGKLCGSALILGLNTLLVFGITTSLFLFYGGLFSSQLCSAFILIYAQSLIILSISMVFSVYSSPALTAMITIGIALIGSSVSQLLQVVERQSNTTLREFLRIAIHFIPNLEHFNLENKVLYQIAIHPLYVPGAVAYATVICTFALGCSAFLLSKKRL